MQKSVVVVGAGIIGTTISCLLAKAGAEVTLIDKSHPASGASGGSFGWINANWSNPKDYFTLRHTSMQNYPWLCDVLNLEIKPNWPGCLYWENSEQGMSMEEKLSTTGYWQIAKSQMQSHCEKLQSFGYAAQVVSADQFSELVPNFKQPPEIAIHFERDGEINPLHLTQALFHCAINLGVRVHQNRYAEELLIKDSCVTGVRTSKGEINADTTVLATGIGASALLKKIDIKLPMENRDGMIATTEPCGAEIEKIIFGGHFHVKQHSDGRLIIGETINDSPTYEHPDLLLAEVRNCLRIHLPEYAEVKFENVTVKTRPIPADGYPVIGEPKAHPGLYVAVTHSGVTLAPLIGRLAIDEILNNKSSELLKAFRVERFN